MTPLQAIAKMQTGRHVFSRSTEYRLDLRGKIVSRPLRSEAGWWLVVPLPKFLLLFALVLLAIACQPVPSTDLRLSGDTATDARLVNAAAQWCEATAGACCPTVTSAGSVRVQYDDTPATDCPPSTTALACTHHTDDGEVWLSFSTSADDQSVLHELGHLCRAATGADANTHLPDGVGVMSRRGQQATVTNEDMQYVRGQ